MDSPDVWQEDAPKRRAVQRVLWITLHLNLAVAAAACTPREFTPEEPEERVNTIVILEESPDLAHGGHRVKTVTLRGYDSDDEQVYGPVEETYDEEMRFIGLPHETVAVKVAYNRGPGHAMFLHRRSVDFEADEDGTLYFENVNPDPVGTRETFTVKIVNNSAYAADEVFVIVLGKDAGPPTTSQQAFWYLDIQPDDNNTFVPFGGVDQWESVSQPLSQMVSEGANAFSFQCPRDKLWSGRIYLSFGSKIQSIGLVNPDDPLSLQLPSASGLPGAQTVYEFMELSATFQPQAPDVYTLFANTSVVDFFSIGLGMTLHYQEAGEDTTQQVGFVDNARQLVLEEFQKSSTPAEFQNFIKKDGSDVVLKVLAPVQAVAMDPTGPLSAFLQGPIDEAWALYAQTVLNIPDDLPGHEPYGYAYSGELIIGDTLAMTCTQSVASDPDSLNEVSSLPRPTSRIVFFCDDDQAAAALPDNQTWRNRGTDGHKRLVSLLSAAINRGVFDNYANWADPNAFYSRADGKYNHYAKIMHQFAIDQKVYGFGYDDVYGQDPTLAKPLADVNQIVLTIPPFGPL
jgi:hypothetical protein